jgi:hypothetical protein
MRPRQLGIIHLECAVSCQHGSTITFRKRTHQFGGTLFGGAVSSLVIVMPLYGKRLVIHTILVEAG